MDRGYLHGCDSLSCQTIRRIAMGGAGLILASLAACPYGAAISGMDLWGMLFDPCFIASLSLWRRDLRKESLDPCFNATLSVWRRNGADPCFIASLISGLLAVANGSTARLAGVAAGPQGSRPASVNGSYEGPQGSRPASA
eukprot:1161878-Pelagomonas_calceolata.AAC.5